MKSSENKEWSAVPLRRNSSFGWELISNRQKNSSWFCLGDIFFLMAWKANIIRHCDVHAWLHVLNIKLIWKWTQHANEGLNYSISNSPPPTRHWAVLGWGKCPTHGLAKTRTFEDGLIPCPEEAGFSQSWKSQLWRQRNKSEPCKLSTPACCAHLRGEPTEHSALPALGQHQQHAPGLCRKQGIKVAESCLCTLGAECGVMEGMEPSEALAITFPW